MSYLLGILFFSFLVYLFAILIGKNNIDKEQLKKIYKEEQINQTNKKDIKNAIIKFLFFLLAGFCTVIVVGLIVLPLQTQGIFIGPLIKILLLILFWRFFYKMFWNKFIKKIYK